MLSVLAKTVAWAVVSAAVILGWREYHRFLLVHVVAKSWSIWSDSPFLLALGVQALGAAKRLCQPDHDECGFELLSTALSFSILLCCALIVESEIIPSRY